MMVPFLAPIVVVLLFNSLSIIFNISTASNSIHNISYHNCSTLFVHDFMQCLQNTCPDSLTSSAIFLSENNTSNFLSTLHSRIENRRHSTPEKPKPYAIIAAKTECDVRATVLCSRRHGLQVKIRSGGHDYEGVSSVSNHVPFVILDMLNLRSIEINMTEETAWVEAGASLGELYYKIAQASEVHGFSASCGPGVCAGGHFSGGGYGPMLRKYGLTVDNIIDAKIMDANGRVLDKESMGEDVFWAIRGGGGGSFGVILSWKIKLNRVPGIVTVFDVERSSRSKDNGLEAMHRWQYIASNLPEEVFIRAVAEVKADDDQRRNEKPAVRVSFIGLYLGQTKELVSLLEKSFPELGLEVKECHEMSWVESTVFWADYPVGTPIDVLLKRLNEPTELYKIKSDYVKEPISKQGIESIFEMMLEVGGQVWMKWNPYGGRMSEIAEWETPFPHRAGNLFLIQYYFYWHKEGAEAEQHHLTMARKFYDKMTPFVSQNPRAAFLNYRDLDIGENPDNYTDLNAARAYGRKYFKDNFDKLMKAKTIIDPDNFFKNGQSIPPLDHKTSCHDDDDVRDTFS